MFPLARRFLVGALWTTCASVGCAKSPTSPTPLQPPQHAVSIDFPEAWTHDGQYIAFRRVVASRDGPAGIYLVHRLGGHLRYVAPASFYWPQRLSFSADDRFLVGSDNLQLVIIDTYTGQLAHPLFATNGANYPDWAPHGSIIVYSRVLSLPGAPAESSGIHLFNVDTGEDRPLVHQDTVRAGTDPIWSRQGQTIAFVEHTATPPGRRIVVASPDGASLRPVWTPLVTTTFSELAWYSAPLQGTQQLLVNIGAQTYIIDPATTEVRPFDFRKWLGIVSPNGTELVRQELDPDTVGVLFITRMDDYAGASRRQITRWAP
jgi:Tol biopolymer transport system component